MKVEEFGEILLKTGDLDPIYVILHRANLAPDLRARWLVAYTHFYHAGVASRLAEAGGWAPYEEALATAPRGTERRHFRGGFAGKAVAALRNTYEAPEAFYEYIAGGRDLSDVISRVKEHYGFGDWIAFKWADLLERCCGVPLSFDQGIVFMFESPRKAVDVLWEERVAPINRTKLNAKERQQRIVDALLDRFKGYMAPPSMNRPVNIQEIETILCKFLSHKHGHYPIGKDIHEIRNGLIGFGGLATKLEKYLPPEVVL